MRNHRPRGRRRRRAIRASALSLLLGFQVLSLAPLLLLAAPLGGSGRSSLTRRDPAGADRGHERERDKGCVARKTVVEKVVAGERRGPLALEPAPAAAASRATAEAVLTNPTTLRIFLPANPHNLRAPPVQI